MILGILIVFFSIILLIVIHELGHFLLAKKFGVRVEEFGIGIPPRIYGKKIGETIYSLNWLPIGAFVKIYGEEEKIKDPRSFSEKPIWQRFFIIAAGVINFWLVAFILLTFMAKTGMPGVIEDQDIKAENPKVQIIYIQENSPAQLSGLKTEDTIKKIQDQEINKVIDVQEKTKQYLGQEVSLLIERQGELINTLVFLRESDEEGALGVGLVRTGIKKYSWYQAPVHGFSMTAKVTSTILINLSDAFYRLITKKPMSDEFEVVGPIGIGVLAFQSLEKGLIDYLWLIVLISISLAIFNLLPIPALDGGRLLFLVIEKIKGKPINNNLEKKLIGVSFIILLGLFFLIVLRDILKLEAINNFIQQIK
ncbi:MAG: M50 family metallopeptidase [Candidatus Pacebacteria bacterium]|nr:M50 family metallopeptidase [Candidatus Paceibacterota bacterium]